MPSFLPENDTPLPSDNEMRSLQKIVDLCGAGAGGGPGSPNFKEIFSGNGDPTGVVIPIMTDAIYRQLDSVPVGLIWTWKSPGPWIAPSP